MNRSSAACASARISDSFSSIQPTSSNAVEICGLIRDAEKFWVQPTTSVVAPICCDGACRPMHACVPGVVMQAEIRISTDEPTSLATTPLTRTITGAFSYLPNLPKLPLWSGVITGGGGGGPPATWSKPCEPIDSGVGLGSKPCVAMSRLVRIVISRGRRWSLLCRRRRSSARSPQRCGWWV